jgi:hypothetical protein
MIASLPFRCRSISRSPNEQALAFLYFKNEIYSFFQKNEKKSRKEG